MHSHTDSAWGGWGGGGDTIGGGGGGSANREPGSYMAPLSNASDLGIWIDLLLTKVAINRLDNQ